MNNVTWLDLDNMAYDNSTVQKIVRLLDKSGATDDLAEGMQVALKINTAEPGYEYGLRPGLLKAIADQVSRLTRKAPAICDGHRLVDYWNRSKGNAFLKTAGARGYSNETLGGNFVINGGYSGDEGDLFSCGPDSELGGVEVGTAVCRSDVLWVISHVTLHPLFGLCGALLNSGFECLSGRAKTRVLNGTSPYLFNGSLPEPDQTGAFVKRALECNTAVSAAMSGHIFYINILWDVTPQPEYYPYSGRPVMENMGFMASRDPVALDHATHAVISDNLTDNHRDNHRLAPDFSAVIREAENSGIGTSGYQLDRFS